MAEGLLRALYSDRYEAYSAGTEPINVNPYAIKVMAEIGIDISMHRSKSIEEFRNMKFDYVTTVCAIHLRNRLFSDSTRSSRSGLPEGA